ncbi:SulP family inorganic anion transporter [Rhodovulum adriaticum]|uniref:SulP family sulfate permease n=1 Tax=Rhodovulum adriaticum TaxID=35804 RepID=A0A4R2NJX0_RHOAD|nr:SulP family inorganic anion transporter [Rhodovulum adriaticum]MBK1635532.1 sodium-independent anion transporter [Rhodovulum adriaticum]TCP21833.1 SulP family sulfate permease [Rhodovulum adriaticum]
MHKPAPPIQQFIPKIAAVLAEGYGLRHLRADLVAGLTVAVVALPLSLAIAIASGVPPDRGLITAIVGGFLVSLLGGSRFQIGGPAGAFIVLVMATVQRHGLDGLMLATFLSGLFLSLAGALRLGGFVKFIPYPVTVGFTAGIGVIILASQMRPLLGLTLAGPEPGPFLEKLPALWAAMPTLDPLNLVLGLGAFGLILVQRRVAPRVPGMLLAIVLAGLTVWLLDLPVPTIGSAYGGIAAGLPAPHLPDFTLAKVQAVLPDALAFTLLGAIESLLSAVVADSMTGRRHRSNAELVGQGVANMASACFGGFCVTGTIARTATNVRAGAHGPVAGMIHALTLLVIVLLLAPLASAIPLAALAGVLVSVALHMIDIRAIRTLARTARAELAVLLATLTLTVLRDLTEAIVVGLALGALVFMNRMAQISGVDAMLDEADTESRPQDRSEGRETIVLRLTGAYFFGSAPVIENVLDRIAARPRRLILDLADVPLLDMTGAHSLTGFIRKARDNGMSVTLAAARDQHMDMLRAAGLPEGVVRAPDMAAARRGG